MLTMFPFQPAAAPQAKKQAKGKDQPKPTPAAAKSPAQAPAPAAAAKQEPAPSAERDMSMAAVLGRLATRASQADQIVAHLKTQISAARQTAGGWHKICSNRNDVFNRLSRREGG